MFGWLVLNHLSQSTLPAICHCLMGILCRDSSDHVCGPVGEAQQH